MSVRGIGEGHHSSIGFRTGVVDGALHAAYVVAEWPRLEVPPNWMEPEQAGELVAEGILGNQTYIVTHGFFKDRMRERADAMLAATPDTKEEAPDFGQYRDE